MEKFLKILAILFTALVVIMLLFSAGTVIPSIPLFGSVANFVTVGFMHLWLPVCGAVFVIALIGSGLGDRLRGLYMADSFLSGVTLMISAFLILSVVISLKAKKLKVNLMPGKEDVSQVTTETFVYTRSQYGDVELNVYALNDGQADKPVMVYIHGGGWVQGSKEDHTYYSKVFAQHGYVTVSVDYDLSSEERHLAQTTEQQITEAFVWVRDNIEQFGGDADKLFVTGGSAGATMALNIAFGINNGEITASDDGKELPRVRALSVNFPVCDLADFYNNDDPVLGKTARRMAYSYTGGSPEALADLYDRMRPVSHVSGDLPAVNIFIAAGDTLVPPGATYELIETLKERKYDVQMTEIPYGNHMYDMVEGGMGCNAYLESSLKWFEEHMDTE